MTGTTQNYRSTRLSYTPTIRNRLKSRRETRQKICGRKFSETKSGTERRRFTRIGAKSPTEITTAVIVIDARPLPACGARG